MIEVRWHGRAGQGAKTASQLLAEAALEAGRYVQAFPEYGPERSGAPMRAFNRIDSEPIRRRYGVTHPDAVVVLDPSLMYEPFVSEGVGENTIVLVNSDRSRAELRRELPGDAFGVAAGAIAAERGSKYTNVVMLGAVAAAIGEPPLETLERVAGEYFGAKLGPDGAAAIAAAIRTGYEVVEELELVRD